MSANTNISEGGKARPFGPIKALMVEGDDGKFYSWYPESEKALGTLSVDKNGVYRASDKGVYGWGQVYVNVATSDSVTGRDPDTGEEVVVRPDPETGEITETVVPVEIRVIEPPTNPYGTYVDDQTITKDGMVVKAYGANGDEMQVVPIGEITINPTVAVYDASSDTPAGGEKSSDLATGFVQPIPYQSRFEANFPNDDKVVVSGADGFIAYHTSNIQNYIVAGKNPGTYTVTRINASDPAHPITSQFNLGGTPFIHDGKSVYYAELQTGPHPAGGEATRKNGETLSPGGAAWTIMYGEGEEHGAGSPQTITVSWPRPGDGAILETTFEITVGPHGGTGDD